MSTTPILPVFAYVGVADEVPCRLFVEVVVPAASQQRSSGGGDEGERVRHSELVFHAYDPFLASSSYENGKRSLQRQKNLKSSFGLIRSAWIIWSWRRDGPTD
jgi:hypothetical protein